MAYGSALVDNIQSSTANTPVVFKDGNGTQIGTLCRAWVNFNGTGTVAIRSSFNVSSITDNGTGDYTVNFTAALPNANYAIGGSTGYYGDGTSGGFLAPNRIGSSGNESAPTTTSCRVTAANVSGGVADVKYVSVAIFD